MTIRRWLMDVGALMAIARTELIEGGRCLYRTRLAYGDGSGAAVSIKLRPAKVLKVAGGVADIQLLDCGREIRVAFSQLEADEKWLDEHDRKEEQKKKRIEQERLESERLASGHVAPLKHSLGDALKAAAVVPDESDGVPLSPADLAKLDKMRSDALEKINALKSAALTPVPPPEHLATVHTLRAVHPIEPTAAVFGVPPGFITAEPEPEPEPEPDQDPEPLPKAPEPIPLPAPVVEPEPAPPQPAPAPEQLPLDPTQMLLRKIQTEFEQLIADEAELDVQVIDAERQLHELTALLDGARPKLAANRARQAVLSAQERQVLKLAMALAVTTTPKPSTPLAPTPHPAAQPAATAPAAPPAAQPVARPQAADANAGARRGLDGAQTPSPVLRGHDTKSEAQRAAQAPRTKSNGKSAKRALPAAEIADGQWDASPVPGWLRRKPGSIAASVQQRATEVVRTPRQRRTFSYEVDLSDPLERAIDDIAKAKEGRE